MYVFALIKSRKSPQNMLIYVYVELLVLYSYYFFSTLKALVNQIFDVLCVLFSEFQCACNVSCKSMVVFNHIATQNEHIWFVRGSFSSSSG